MDTDFAGAAALPCLDAMRLVERELPITRRTLQPGDLVQRAGDTFHTLRIVNSGVLRVMSSGVDGCEQVTSIQFKGGWIGFDGIATGRHTCEAIAMDVSQVWSVDYRTLLASATRVPSLMHMVHVAMSGQMAYERNWLLAMSTLPAEARLAMLLYDWAQALAARALRIDPIMLRMSRSEMASYLCMTHETLSRAFSRFRACGLISFIDAGRQAVTIPSLPALADVANLRRPVTLPDSSAAVAH